MNPSRHLNVAVRLALKHYTDPAWLGNHSALATPYVLGDYLNRAEDPATSVGRGQALQALILEAATTGWGEDLPDSRRALLECVEAERNEIGNGGLRFLFLVLDLRYLRHYFSPRTPPNSVGAMYDFLAVSESAFFRYLTQAVEQLVEAFRALIRPNLRLEQPTLTADLIGRDTLLNSVKNDLNETRSVSISGLGGIGKTSLGIAVRQAWVSEGVFWYTFRPGLNDDVVSLLFGLGHFLHQWQRSSLWLQLTAKGGQLDDIQQAIGFLANDLAQSKSLPLLFCFDEVDLLHTAVSQPRHGVHKQILELLDGLRGQVPLLFIGQRPLLDTDSHYALQALTLEDVKALMLRRGLDLSAVSAKDIHRRTQGNPRLLELYLALLGDGTDDPALLFGKSSALRPLLNRLWKRLGQSEKQVLAGLSVFRSPAPEDNWVQEAGLAGIRERHLLKRDAGGGVALLPFFRELVYGELPIDQKQSLHQQAAVIRATLGQFTEAAYHFWKADDVERAVRVWWPHQDVEISQGKAAAAHHVFNAIEGEPKRGEFSRQLKVIQNRLHLLFGDAEQVLKNMNDYSWHLDEPLSIDALEQWSNALWQEGRADEGLVKLDEAIETAGRLSSRITQLHVRRAQLTAGMADYVAAEREATRAQYEVERLYAFIATNRGHYREAQSHLKKAIELAEAAGDERRVAMANKWLAVCAGNLGDLNNGRLYAEAAMAYFERIGDRLETEGIRAELAGFYLNVGRFAEVIEPAERALKFFEQIKHDVWPGYICSNLAEAYYELGALEKAEMYALRARNSEDLRLQPYAYYTLGQIHEAKGNFSGANHSFQTGIEIASRTENKFISAYLHRVYGQFLCREKPTEEGVGQIRLALTLFTELSISGEIDKTMAIIEEIELSLK